MAVDKFIADLKANFQRGDIVTKLVYINAGVFLLISLVGIVLTLLMYRLLPGSITWSSQHGCWSWYVSPGRCLLICLCTRICCIFFLICCGCSGSDGFF